MIFYIQRLVSEMEILKSHRRHIAVDLIQIEVLGVTSSHLMEKNLMVVISTIRDPAFLQSISNMHNNLAKSVRSEPKTSYKLRRSREKMN